MKKRSRNLVSYEMVGQANRSKSKHIDSMQIIIFYVALLYLNYIINIY